MSDFIREVDEEYRQDQFRRFLSRYWVALLLLVVVVLAAAGGWRGYGYYRQQQAEAAGARYFDALDALPTDPKAALAGFDALAVDGPAGYRTLARFRAAGELGRTDVSGAVKGFDALAADASVPQELRDIAALRAGLLVVDTADPAELGRRLGPLADANSAFRSVAREMLAAAALKRGDDAGAGKWLDAIEADPLASPDSRQRAGFLLGVVRAGRPAPASAPTAAKPEPGAPPAAKASSGVQPADKPEPGVQPADKPEPGTQPADKPEPGTQPADKPEPGTQPAEKPEPGVQPAEKP